MADIKNGISDEINIIEKSGSTDITAELGLIENGGWEFTFGESRESSVGRVPNFEAAIEEMAELNVSLSIKAPSLKAMKLMGSYSEDSGAGTWTVDLTDFLPEFDMKLQVTDSKVLRCVDIKWGEATISVGKEEAVVIEFSGMCLDAEVLDETISTPEPASDPAKWIDAELLIDSTKVAAIDSASITYTRDLEAVTHVGAKSRMPQKIIEKMKDFTYDMTIEITDTQAWEETFDGASFPLTAPDGEKQEIAAAMQLLDTQGSFEVQESKITDNSGEVADDAEIRTVDISGQGNKAVIEGTL